MKGQRRFEATVETEGINAYVDLPDDVADEFGRGSHPPVLVQAARIGHRPVGAGRRLAADADRLEAIERLTEQGWFRTSLIRSPRRPVRLYLDQWMRDAAGLRVGEPVRITLAPDSASREPRIPERLAETLATDDQATAAWETLSPSRRREILRYLGFLKTDAALKRNVRKVMPELRRPGVGAGRRDPRRQAPRGS